MKTAVRTGSGFCSQLFELPPTLLMKLSSLLPKGKSKLRCKNHLKRNPEIIQPPGSIPSLHSEILFFTYSLELSKGNVRFSQHTSEKKNYYQFITVLFWEKTLKRNQVKRGWRSSMFFRVNTLFIKVRGTTWVNYIWFKQIKKYHSLHRTQILCYLPKFSSFLKFLLSHGVLLPKQGTTSLPAFL